MTNLLKFMVDEKLRNNRDSCSYRVMIFKPIGHYPEGLLFTPNSFFSADNDVVFSVTFGSSWQSMDEEIPYSEFDWASPEELRLLISILLCEKREDALVNFYPVVGYSPRIDVKNIDIKSRHTVQLIKELLIKTVNSRDDILSECVCGDYRLVSPDHFSLDRLLVFWNKISPKNYVLMKGVYSLIKADMLACHRGFCEEAIIVSYIALDASFHLVRQRLISNGVKNPTANDAALWLHEYFDKAFGLPAPTIEKYFEEFYEDRVRTLHPASRFGESPISPISHDDFTHLRRSLREIFAYLVTDEHGADYHEDIEFRRTFNK